MSSLTYYSAGREGLIRLRPYIDPRPAGTVAPWNKPKPLTDAERQRAAAMFDSLARQQMNTIGRLQAGAQGSAGLFGRGWPLGNFLGE
jgi:hypothetical protein